MVQEMGASLDYMEPGLRGKELKEGQGIEQSPPNISIKGTICEL